MGLSSAGAQAQATAPHQTPCRVVGFPAPVLCARAGLDTIHATYVVMVDESGSMAPLWPTVRGALAAFAHAVPDGDELDVRLFSDHATDLIAPVPASAAARTDWARRFNTLAPPRGAHTDLGAAASAALRTVASAPPDRQQFLIFLTDGEQDPAPGSSFGRSWNDGWESLASQANTLARARPVSFAIVRLTDQADRSLLARALPGAVVHDAIGPAALEAWFAHQARDVALAKLKLHIERDLRRPAFRVTTDAALTLGGDVTGTLTSSRGTVDGALMDSAMLQLPGGARIIVHAGSDARTATLATAAPPARWYLPPTRLRDSLSVTVPARVRLQPSAELARIGIDPGPRPDSLRLELRLAGAGIARVALYWLAVAVLAAVIAWSLVLAKWASHSARLSGHLVLRPTAGDDERVDLAAAGTSHTVRAPDGRTVVTLRARAYRGRTVVTAVPDGAPVTLHGRRLSASTRIHGSGRIEHADLSIEYFLR